MEAMRRFLLLVMLLTSCASNEHITSPNILIADSGSYVFLLPDKAKIDGYLTKKSKQELLVYGLPYVDADTEIEVGDYKIMVVKKDFGESRIEIEDQNLVTPVLADQERASAEYLKVKKITQSESEQYSMNFKFQTPIKSVITSAYGKRRYINNIQRSPHMALDLRGATGREIFAPKKGKVVLAENHFYAGNKIILDHGGGLFTAYSHLSGFNIKMGDIVETGDLIGFVGMTGRVTGPHLHWEVFLNGNRINPELLVDLEYAQD